MRLGGDNDAGLLADFADALAAANNRRFPDEAGVLLSDALKLQPDNIKALWLAGHWKLQTGDAASGISYWERAAELLPPDSEDRLVIASQIRQLRQQAGLPADTQQAANESTAVTPTPAVAANSLQVTVTLDPAFADRANPEDTVFIFARAAQGPRMPLAIARKRVSDLPVTVTLDDSMAMAPGMVLSGFEEVTVGARISKSGNAMAQSGDLQGSLSPVRHAETARIEIVIDSAVP